MKEIVEFIWIINKLLKIIINIKFGEFFVFLEYLII